MLRIVISASVMSAITFWSALPSASFKLQPNMLLSAGIRAIGSVAHTDATVRMPAKM